MFMAQYLNIAGIEHSLTKIQVLSAVTVGVGMFVAAKGIDEMFFAKEKRPSTKIALSSLAAIAGGGSAAWLGTICLNNSLAKI